MASALLHFLCAVSLLLRPASTGDPPPGCKRRCGDAEIPYPFGIEEGCYLDETFRVSCDEATGSAVLAKYGLNIDDISVSSHTFRHKNFNGVIIPFERTAARYVHYAPWFIASHYRISHARNTFVAMGCDFFVYLVDEETKQVQGSCSSLCNGEETVRLHQLSTCSGIDCCRISFPANLRNFSVRFQTTNSWMPNSVKHCGLYTFVDNDFLRENELKLVSCNVSTSVPMFHEWAVGNMKCDEAIRAREGYFCGQNAECFDYPTDVEQYRCRCRNGYRGNPYLSNGCQDFDECENSIDNKCTAGYLCVNTPGSYYCSLNHSKTYAAFISLGTGLAVSILGMAAFGMWTWRKLEKIKEQKMKQRFFKRNGGLLLQQRISSSRGSGLFEVNLFKIEELEKATDGFNKSRVLGKGGMGTVYKGMLTDGRIVAVKKAHTIDDKQIGQFVNEVFILSQINHRHIVKMLGCCLESEIPLLVYEYISNGTLYQHLHLGPNSPMFSWDNRLRVVAEIASALAYLHSFASTSIFHRDIKSNNILLDENYRAVVSDFGLSRSVPIDKTHLTTAVGGTFGYLDPQYFRTGQLNAKSDVYAFGVVIAEVLTGQNPVSVTTGEEAGLAYRFRMALKEGSLFEMLEKMAMHEDENEQIVAVAILAKRCLKLNAKMRPSMKEVAGEVDQLRKDDKAYDHRQESCSDKDYASTIENCSYFESDDLEENDESSSLISSRDTTGNTMNSFPASFHLSSAVNRGESNSRTARFKLTKI